ncbi:c-type cytochrome domain-containing protein [Luteolibacter marinus]|uniref:c-type cytochrome domain-containing protein n=1 Tax=Luteolibacter marinus TaxID=2776705 RepID=UPI001866D0CC|nr:c-type cytochrome domain-containing protein [Luteolibacter marinus]
MNHPALPVFLVAGLLTANARALDYEKDVMPIFEAKCYDCHSAKSKKVKGGLRLDDPEGFFKRFAKNDVVIPGDWDASYLFVTITKPREEKHAMPPEDRGDPLTPEEITTVAKWIHEGARIGRERGDKGSKDRDPEKVLRFKDGVLVTETLEEEAPPEVPAAPLEWTNREGRKIIATFRGLEDGKVHLELENGNDAFYPLDKLSDESQAVIRELAAGPTG